MSRAFGLLALLVWVTPAGVAEAMCVSPSAEEIEFELLACRPAEVAIGERIAGTDLWWLRPYLESVAHGNPGVVLRGRTLRSRATGQQASATWEEGDEAEEEVFFTSSDPDFCGTFEGLGTVTLIKERPCCDVIPPPNVACVLEVAEVRALHPDRVGPDQDSSTALDPGVSN